jgi:hypothetical protein
MKIKVLQINGCTPVMFGNRPAMEVDITECCSRDIFYGLWEANGDELIEKWLANEGWIVSKPNAKGETQT